MRIVGNWGDLKQTNKIDKQKKITLEVPLYVWANLNKIWTAGDENELEHALEDFFNDVVVKT